MSNESQPFPMHSIVLGPSDAAGGEDKLNLYPHPLDGRADGPFGGVGLEIHTYAWEEEIPEGNYPEDFGPGPHFVYPNVSLNVDQARQLRDYLSQQLGE